MEYKVFGHKIVLRVQKGTDILSAIKDLCEKENIRAGSINGLGLASEIEGASFNVDTKEFTIRQFKGTFEICNINGTISNHNGEVHLHIHGVWADEALKTYGGHINKAIVGATAEIFINKIDGELGRTFDEETGLNLLTF